MGVGVPVVCSYDMLRSGRLLITLCKRLEMWEQLNHLELRQAINILPE